MTIDHQQGFIIYKNKYMCTKFSGNTSRTSRQIVECIVSLKKKKKYERFNQKGKAQKVIARFSLTLELLGRRSSTWRVTSWCHIARDKCCYTAETTPWQPPGILQCWCEEHCQWHSLVPQWYTRQDQQKLTFAVCSAQTSVSTTVCSHNVNSINGRWNTALSSLHELIEQSVKVCKREQVILLINTLHIAHASEELQTLCMRYQYCDATVMTMVKKCLDCFYNCYRNKKMQQTVASCSIKNEIALLILTAIQCGTYT